MGQRSLQRCNVSLQRHGAALQRFVARKIRRATHFRRGGAVHKAGNTCQTRPGHATLPIL
jgi:hypothetical protein